jgi:ectoine hydroxylase-related dioxygenase (phytanoyl-CoA dioxygenase family)
LKYDKTRLEMEPRQPPTGRFVRRIYEPCTYYAHFRELSESEALLASVEQLLGPNLLFHYSKINMKPSEIGSVVEWHQDLTYDPLTNTDSLAVLFYLDDTKVENGCLQVIPGLQSSQPLDHTLNGFFQGRITESVDNSRAVPIVGRAGTAIFMNCLVPHASATNTSNRPRRTLILSYRAADAFPVYAGEATVKGELHVRLVRGVRSAKARFTLAEFPIPKQERATASLYELQELSRTKLGETGGLTK